LTKIDLYSAIIHQSIVHLEISFYSLLFLCKFNECVLQRVSCIWISNDFSLDLFVEAGKDQLEILVFGHWI